jgi:nitrogen-specific signal transduction histidine kinase
MEGNGSTATIEVSDNGPGIPVAIREKLFHPFVSFGKENGTGLGLTVVQKIVQDHGGTVVMDRTADSRTVFRITIPAGGPHEFVNGERTGNSFLPANSHRATENSIRHSEP